MGGSDDFCFVGGQGSLPEVTQRGSGEDFLDLGFLEKKSGEWAQGEVQ